METLKNPKRSKGRGNLHCCYGTCNSDSRRNQNNEFYFLPFPKPCPNFRNGLIFKNVKTHISSCDRCKKAESWVKLCNQKVSPRKKSLRTIDDITKDTYICSMHFKNKSGPSESESPIPCLKRKSTLSRTDLETKYRRIEKEDIQINSVFELPSEVGEAGTMSDDMNRTTTRSELKDTESLQLNCVNMETQTTHSTSVEIGTQTEHTEECKKFSTTSTQTTLSLFPHMKQLSKYKTLCNVLKSKLYVKNSDIHKFESSIRNDDKQCFFYTGLHFTQILTLMTFLGPCVNNLKYWNSKTLTSPQRGNRKRKFSPLQELVIVLMRLRRGFLVADLAYRFKISVGHVTNISITWIQFMYLEFAKLRPHMFPSRHQILENLPKVFSRLKNIRVLVDCTEFFCQVPSNFEHQGNLYSTYKAHTTFKVLIGCTPNGAISFVSDLFEGAVSDRELFEKSKIVDLLEEGDLVLADRGFTVEDLLMPAGAKLNIPPFLKGRSRLTAQEEIETKKIAKERIYVEHAIGRLKRFRFLNRTIPLNMRGVLNQIVFLCACLVNFQPPIIID